MNRKKIIIIILLIVTFSYFYTGLKDEQPAEDLETVSGFGVDLKANGKSDIVFVAPSSIYTFEEGEKVSSGLRTGTSITPAETREDRQLISNKQYVLGLEKLYLFSESIASKGIIVPIESFFRNLYTNDNASVAICSSNPEEILKCKVSGYPSSADYIDGMLRNAKMYNFFPSVYKISDIFLNLDTEGKNIIIPVIDETTDKADNKFKITGLCLFKKDKMIGKLNIKDSKYLNMLRKTDGKGVISLIQSPYSKHLNYYAKVKRKVKAYKNGNRYKYVINLQFKGDIVSNTIYPTIRNKISTNDEVQKKLEENIEQSCKYIINKLKTQYKIDALDLGQYAAAKYGREKGIDWDDVFINADIEVNVKVKIDRIGRGGYFLE